MTPHISSGIRSPLPQNTIVYLVFSESRSATCVLSLLHLFNFCCLFAYSGIVRTKKAPRAALVNRLKAFCGALLLWQKSVWK